MLISENNSKCPRFAAVFSQHIYCHLLDILGSSIYQAQVSTTFSKSRFGARPAQEASQKNTVTSMEVRV